MNTKIIIKGNNLQNPLRKLILNLSIKCIVSVGLMEIDLGLSFWDILNG